MQRLALANIRAEQTTTLGRRASGIYATLRAKVLEGKIELLDNSELLTQLRRLEIVRTSGGAERCEASSGHDDVAIACALSVYQVVATPQREATSFVMTFPVQQSSVSMAGHTSALAQEPGASSFGPRISAGPMRPITPLADNDCGPERWWTPIGRD